MADSNTAHNSHNEYLPTPPPTYEGPPKYKDIFEEEPSEHPPSPRPVPAHQPTIPISTQPRRPTSDRTRIPARQFNYCQGLDELASIDYLRVLQDERPLLTNVKNFTIKNKTGQSVYHAVEDSSLDCCYNDGTPKPFDLRICDRYNYPIIHVHRPPRCDCCFPLEKIEVSAPPGNVIGTVEQDLRFFGGDVFAINNPSGDVVLKIKCPYITGAFGANDFIVLSPNGSTHVGKISKLSEGLMTELFVGSYNFEITFPMDLDTNMKAIILGTCFLIKCMFYEERR